MDEKQADFVESVNGKFNAKIHGLIKIGTNVPQLVKTLTELLKLSKKKVLVEAVLYQLNAVNIAPFIQKLRTIADQYEIETLDAINQYFNAHKGGETQNAIEKYTVSYYRIVTRDNYFSQIDAIGGQMMSQIQILCAICRDLREINKRLFSAPLQTTETQIYDIIKDIEFLNSIRAPPSIEQCDYEICDCGNRMVAEDELSELVCQNCHAIRRIVGAIFRDEQFCSQDGQKMRHHNSVEIRHCKLWMGHIQGTSAPNISEEVLAKINTTVGNYNCNRERLSCETIRAVLKDPEVNHTELNSFATYLVIYCGGPPPPRLTHDECCLTQMRFCRAMELLGRINPGIKSKYYPYYILKIWEEMFRDDPQKLLIIKYIHLQSMHTIMKNDALFEKICEIADPSDGLVYRPTDPSGCL